MPLVRWGLRVVFGVGDTKMEFLGVAERLIRRTDWPSYRKIGGQPAESVGVALAALLALEGPEEARRLSDNIESEVAPQSNLYSACEPTMAVLSATFVDARPFWVRTVALDLMYLILNGAPVQDEVALGNAALREICVSRARESMWALVKEAVCDSRLRRSVSEVLQLIDAQGSASALALSDEGFNN